jgi:hypothetical protein
MKMPITMLNGMGCPDCDNYARAIEWRRAPFQKSGAAGMGALGVTREEVYNFFVGPKKWTKNTKPTNLYVNPGEAPVSVIPALEAFFIVDINQSANWGKLSTGKWVHLADSMFTVILDVTPPTSVSDAVGREAEKVVDAAERIYNAIPILPSITTLKTLLWVGAGVGVVILLAKANDAGLLPKKKLALAGHHHKTSKNKKS